MIIAERKDLDDILDTLNGAHRILVVGCGTCVAVCMAGGEKEVGLLATELRMAAKLRGVELEIDEATIQRQCEAEFAETLADTTTEKDLILSMGCGAGVQFLAERFAPLRVVPAVNTKAIGVAIGSGSWTEYCQACGECVLDRTGGICPIARCSKTLLNGPCGGSVKGVCEIDSEVPCAWQLIYERLKAQGRLDLMRQVIPPKNWKASRHGGPRTITREELNS